MSKNEHQNRSQGSQKAAHTRSRNAEVPQTGEANPAALMTESDTAEKVVELRPAKGVRKNIFELGVQEVSRETGHKLQIMGEARQRLAEAADLLAKGDEFAEQANEIAATAAMTLATGRISGELSADEVTGALGDVFGFKAKQDGSPSKTPKGQGEAIRKRIVRLHAASEFVSGANEEGFFKGCPKDRVEAVLNDTMGGNTGFWAAYEDFAAIKRDIAVSIPLAFNSKKIAEIAEQLQGDGAAEKFVSNAALRQAYSALWAIIRVVGEEAAEIASAA